MNYEDKKKKVAKYFFVVLGDMLKYQLILFSVTTKNLRSFFQLFYSKYTKFMQNLEFNTYSNFCFRIQKIYTRSEF